MTRQQSIFVTSLALLQLTGCATWGYTIEYQGTSPAADQPEAQVVLVAYSGTGDRGTLTIENHTAETAYVIWNTASSIDATGLQRKAYKGSQRRIHSELALPDQPVAPGARIQETIVFDIDRAPFDAVQKRPPTTIDYALGWLYGLGIWIGNESWAPDQDHIDEVLPDWTSKHVTLTVDLNIAGETTTVRLESPATSVQAVRVRSSDPPR